MLGKALYSVRDAIRTGEAGLATQASSQQFCTPTTTGGIHEISPAPPRPRSLARVCPGPPTEVSTSFYDAPADSRPEVWAVTPGVVPSLALPEHGPCLVDGINTLDDASFTTKIAVHSGANAVAPCGWVALLDTGSPQNLIRRDVLDRMLSVGRASVASERNCAPRSWGGFGESVPLQASTSIRLNVHFFRADEPTRSIAVWTCVVPPSMIKHAVLLGRDSWMRFNNRTYRSLPPRPSDHRIFGELELSHHASAGVRAYAVNPVVSGGDFHLCYDGAVGFTLSDDPKLLKVNLVRSNGSQALTGHCLVDMLPQSDLPLEEEHFVASGRQVIPLVGVSNLEPGGLPGVAHAPLMSVPLDALQHVGRPSGLSSDPLGVTPVSAVTAPPLPSVAAPASPSPALRERLTPEQRVSFLRV